MARRKVLGQWVGPITQMEFVNIKKFLFTVETEGKQLELSKFLKDVKLKVITFDNLNFVVAVIEITWLCFETNSWGQIPRR